MQLRSNRRGARIACFWILPTHLFCAVLALTLSLVAPPARTQPAVALDALSCPASEALSPWLTRLTESIKISSQETTAISAKEGNNNCDPVPTDQKPVKPDSKARSLKPLAPDHLNVPDLRSPRFNGFAQGWLGTGFGNRIAGNETGQPFPQGRNYGLDGTEAFRLRRLQVTVDGEFSRRWNYHGMLDLARALDGSSHRDVLQDLWAGYQINPQFRIEVGRQKTGLSSEGSRDDSRLLTIARAVMNEDLPYKAGRVGDARAPGIALRYQGSLFHGLLGLWDDNGSSSIHLDAHRPKFASYSVSYVGIPHLTLSLFGGTHVLGSQPLEVRDRVGTGFIWQQGPHYVEAELAEGRDYAAGAPAPGKTGSLPRGFYMLYGHTISRRLQIIFRYEHWDPAQQTIQSIDDTTETGIPIPHANHKLREYTIGVNYFLPHDQKIQVNYIREDTESNGAVFFGAQRTVLLLNYQIGFNAPMRPEPQYQAYAPATRTLATAPNAIRIGFNAAPTAGFAFGGDFNLAGVRLLPGFKTRLTGEMLGDFHAPSVFGFPGTTFLMTLDQVKSAKAMFGKRFGDRIYGGFGFGGYFQEHIAPGARVFLGSNLTHNFGLELTMHVSGVGRPYVTLETRIPL